MNFESIKYLNIKAAVLLAAALIFSCSSDENGSAIKNGTPPKRIVSLSPSITAEMMDLGSANLIVGVTTWHPPLPENVEIVGNLINPSVEKIILLRPDTILCSKEDSAVQKTEQLKAMKIRIVEFERNRDFESICDNYLILASILGKEKEGEARLKTYRSRLEEIKKRVKELKTKNQLPTIAFFISHKPLITASSLSYINQIIENAGGINIYGNLERAYPYVSAESLLILNPEIIISMVDGGNEFFREILKESNESSLLIKKIHEIDPDVIALYTPANFVNSVEKIFSIIDKYNTSKNLTHKIQGKKI